MRHSSTLSYRVKVLLAAALYYLGILRLWQGIALRRKAVVLMYHRVLSADERERTGSHPAIVVDARTFAKQMAYLSRRFAVLTPEEFTRRMTTRTPFPSSSCLITFDDGWRDNFTNALPILRDRKLPALVFLPVNFIAARRLFWREALTHLLVKVVQDVNANPGRATRFRTILSPAGLASVVDLKDAAPLPAIIDALDGLKPITDASGDGLLSAVAEELGVRPESLDTVDEFMDWNQIAAMAAQGIAFGGHGADHRILTHVPTDVAAIEIDTSKRVIEERLGCVPSAFSYPNGSWRPDVANTVRTSGYRLAFTTEPGTVSCDDEPFTIRRVNIHEHSTDTIPMFLARVLGLL
jgi:peptidoglycan/xylan/chitin deacetylase (PgdA/CDA1 family)